MYLKKYRWLAIVITICLIIGMSACGRARRPEPEPVPRDEERPEPAREPDEMEKEVERPPLPDPIHTEEGQEPNLRVYIVDEGNTQDMAFEEYVAGVVGGEIKNDWPEEVIKAQAIIARTFVLRFINDKGESKYGQGAHVSTDIEEAQAWNTEAVNDRIKKAVNDTKGQVIVYEGEFANTWFHSNAAGKTATAPEGLDYQEENPPYIQVVDSPDDSPDIPEDEKSWTVSFPKSRVINAINESGVAVSDFQNAVIKERGPSGRATTIVFGEAEISAPQLRISIGSTELKSTFIDEISVEGDQVVFTGRGYGHGVGMSQWGGYKMAQEGQTAEDIILHYFKDVSIVDMWD